MLRARCLRVHFLLAIAATLLVVASGAAPRSFWTKVVHGAPYHDEKGSVTCPIYQTSTFRFESAEHGAKCFAGESDGYIYTSPLRHCSSADCLP